MDPETGTITGTPTGNYYNGQQIPVTITLTTQYGMPWGFMPGYMVQEQVYTTTVYFEYQGDNDGPVSIYDIEITETDEGTQITIILTNGEKYTFTIKNGQDGEDGKPGEAGQPGADGEDGQPGADGKPGADGADGVGIADITVNEDGQLVITLTDGTTKTVDVPSSESGNGIAIASLVLSIIEEPEVGKIYNGTVKRIVDFGAFIEILPGKEGLCHISKLARTRVKNVSDVLSVGQQVDVKLIEIDRMGRLNLSYIDAQPDAEKDEKKEKKN